MNLRAAGAAADIIRTGRHAFDLCRQDEPMCREAAEAFERRFAYALEHYSAK